MQLPGFCAERKHYFRNASWACLSEDLANMLKKKKKKSEATLLRLTVFKMEFKEPAFKQMGNARIIYLEWGTRLKSLSKLSESRDNTAD